MASASTDHNVTLNDDSSEGVKKEIVAKQKAVLNRIWALKDRNSPVFEDEYVRQELIEIESRAKDVLQLTKNLFEREDKEILELKRTISDLLEEVSRLEEKVTKLTRRAQNVDIIDAGEAIKLIEHQVATFVLDETEEFGVNAIEDMHDYFNSDVEAYSRWFILAKHCNMARLWTSRHKGVRQTMIENRNDHAHHTKFKFFQLLQTMKRMRPRHKEECEEIVRLFIKVNHLMKFGIIASEFMEMKARSDKCTTDSKNLMDAAKIWDKRNARNVQDIKLKEAKEHVTQYFPDVNDSVWNDAIFIIDKINRPRFGKLVKNKIAEVLDEVPQIFEQIRECQTLGQLLKFSKRARWRSWRWKDGKRWYKSTAGIWWTTNHNDATKVMEGLLPDDHQENIVPLPLDVAKLHVADFVENDKLWEACSEIFEIFDWKKKKYWEHE